MPQHRGGDGNYEWPNPINTETEYQGRTPTSNSVGDRGPEERPLRPDERLRLIRLTGQEEDVDAPRETGFMYGVDSRFPDTDLAENVPEDYRTEDYLS